MLDFTGRQYGDRSPSYDSEDQGHCAGRGRHQILRRDRRRRHRPQSRITKPFSTPLKKKWVAWSSIRQSMF